MSETRCDHKFVDSAACLKCGWIPPAMGKPRAPRLFRSPSTPIECAELERRAAACAHGDPWYTAEQLRVEGVALPKDREFVAALTPAVALRLVTEARKARLAAELFEEHGV